MLVLFVYFFYVCQDPLRNTIDDSVWKKVCYITRSFIFMNLKEIEGLHANFLCIHLTLFDTHEIRVGIHIVVQTQYTVAVVDCKV